MFHSFFNSLAWSRYLSLFSHSFNFTLWFPNPVHRESKVHNSASSLSLLLIIIRSGRLAEIWRFAYILKSQRNLCVSFFRDRFWVVHIPFFSYGQTSTFCTVPSGSPCPTQLCLVLYSFSANLLYLLIMWLIVLSFSPPNPTSAVLWHLIYCRFDIVSPYGVVLCCY